MKEINNNSTFPTARAAHATVTIRENQILMYGGSIGSKLNYFLKFISLFF